MEALKVWSSTISSQPFKHLIRFHFTSSSSSKSRSPRFLFVRCCSSSPPSTTTSAAAAPKPFGRNRRSAASAAPSSTSDSDAIRSIRLKKLCRYDCKSGSSRHISQKSKA